MPRKSNSTENAQIVRVHVLIVGMAAAFLVLVGKLWHEQVVKAEDYASSHYRQTVRRVLLPAVRGTILDRNGKCLARNRPSYCIALYVEELRQPGRIANTVDAIAGVVSNLSAVLELPPEVDRDDIRVHLRKRMPIPFLAWRDISPDALARWAERSAIQPGVDVYVQPVREYPYGEAFGHGLGYVGRADPPPSERKYHYYLPGVEGKAGVERSLDERLAGRAGGKLLRVDASGFRHDEMAERAPREGGTVTLTIDIDFQRAAEVALAGERGAAVIIDPHNGDVLVLASSPSLDPNVFCPSISSTDWRRLRDDPGKPLFNRAVSGIYPPGSTFKPVIALAALHNGRARASTQYDCRGYFALGDVRFRCWNRLGHGRIAMRKAIEQSCNAYFCALGIDCGYERIYHMAEALGFGARTGIALPGEAAGLLPDSEWKQQVIGDRWRAGDTCNVSIGQGALSVTPLQMAAFMATLGNGGRMFRPRLVRDRRAGELIKALSWPGSVVDVVRNGMWDVVQAPNGTGKYALVEGFEMAGKTGTAEYGPRSRRRKHTWMTAFGPFRNPRFAIAMVIEDGQSGGRTVAPRIRELVTTLLEIERSRTSRTPRREGTG